MARIKVDKSAPNIETGWCATAVYFWSSDSQDKVFSYYKNQLTKNGWREIGTQDLRSQNGTNSGTSLGLKKGDLSAQITFWSEHKDPNNKNPGEWFNFDLSFVSQPN